MDWKKIASCRGGHFLGGPATTKSGTAGGRVGRALLKSAPARVTRKDGQYCIVGAAWGAPIQRVKVQIDGGPWQPAQIDRSENATFAWKIWYVKWQKPALGEHTITPRAINTAGNMQPAMDDPWITKKRTYWESNGQVTRRVRLT